MSKGKIIIIGAGKVGTSLALLLDRTGYSVVHVISATAESAANLASRFNCTYSTALTVNGNPDFIMVSVPDQSLKKVLEQIEPSNQETLVIHTAGSYSLDQFPENANYRRGILYPLQTFTSGRQAKLQTIPLFIEGDSDSTMKILKKLASDISDQVYSIGFEMRQKLHLAAVFVSNFVNHMYYAGEKILTETGLPLTVLEPLINETFRKAMAMGPWESQTGPAIRNDNSTIEKHLDLLSFSPELSNIYIAVTESIIKHYIKQSK
ncbi:MAG TPA: DUF2520 domain-containing protein [Bacteroidales bacterium]|nr:DUF2520 domain-containing protein [Bacteroidales bacterium]